MKFKILGTEIYVSFLFCAVISLMLIIDRTGLIIPTLIAALLHELGHLFAMYTAECQPKSIKLIPASVQIVRGFSKHRHGEIFIAFSGPLINIVFFLVFLFIFSTTDKEWALKFAVLNLILALYNLLPVNGLDGGTILKLLLEKRYDPQKADGIVRISAFSLGITVFFIGVFLTLRGNFNISTYIVALYLIITSFIKK